MSIPIYTNPLSPYQLGNTNHSQILTCNWFENPEKFGIPNNLVTKIYDDHNQLQIKNNPKLNSLLRVTYIQDAKCDNELQNLLHVISIFNQLNSVSLKIYCTENYLAILQNYLNEHIQFIKKFEDNEKEISLETDVIITHGPGVIHFLKQQIPVIIIGPCGLGGWINPDNLPFLLKNGFVGRAGGTMGEYIPVEILAHELLAIKECKDLSSILTANKEFVDSLPYKPLSAANKIVDEHKALQKNLYDPHARWQMNPFIASNILFKEATDTVAIKRKHIHDTLCTVSKEDMGFFKAINGKTTCETLCKATQMDEDNFWETIYSLNEKTIILF